MYATGRSDELKGGTRSKGLFIFRVDGDPECDDIREYMKDRNVKAIDVKCMSKPEYRYKSFHVKIEYETYEETMDPSFWPEGFGCRMFRKSRKYITMSKQIDDE